MLPAEPALQRPLPPDTEFFLNDSSLTEAFQSSWLDFHRSGSFMYHSKLATTATQMTQQVWEQTH